MDTTDNETIHRAPIQPLTTLALTMDLPTQTSTPNESYSEILERLNRERAMYNIPAMIWVGFLMFIGVIGNSLVVYVYRRRFKKTSSNYFILTMAIFDLIACVVGMPTEIYDLSHPYTFYSPIGCKIFRGCETFTIYGSAIVLVEIAFDRYFKICWPLMMVSLFKIKMLCALAVVLALCFSIVPLILFGTDRTETPRKDIFGYDCSISEHYEKTSFQKAYFVALAALFILTLLSLTVLYTRIWLEIRCRRRMVIGDQISRSHEHFALRTENGNDHGKGHGQHGRGDGHNAAGGSGSSSGDEHFHDRRKLRINYVPSVSEDESCNNSVSNHPLRSISFTELHVLNHRDAGSSSLDRKHLKGGGGSMANYGLRLKVTRTTVVLFAVTVAFVLSYLPSIAIMVIRSVVTDVRKNQSVAGQVTLKIFSNFFFINNAINPIIYSFLNINFRRQVKKTVQKLFCCFRKRRHSPQKVDSDRSTKKEYLARD